MYYAQIDISTRIVEAETMSHSPIEADHMIEITAEQYGTTRNRRHILETNEFEEVAPPPVRELAKVDYLKRFSQAERIAIRNMGQASAVVNDYIELMNAASVVHLDDPDTVAGVNALEGAGALAAGRAAEILA